MDGIHSARLVLFDSILEDAWITFTEGRIQAFGQGARPELDNWVDGGNHYLAPGLIDIHVHGAMGADFLDGTPEAFETITKFHLSRGTTSLCPTLASARYEQIAAITEVFGSVRDKCVARLLPIHLEGPHLAPSRAGAQDPEVLRPPTDEDAAWLVEHAKVISQITIAPELPNGFDTITRLTDAGICVSLGHSNASEAEAHAAVLNGACKVTHLFNAMSAANKQGLFRQAGLAEYALVEDRLTCELIGDGYHVNAVMAEVAYRCKGPGKLMLVSDALAGAGLPSGSDFRLGRLSCKVADGYCTLKDDSALSGSSTAVIDHVRIMTEKLRIPVYAAIRMATHTPAKIVGMDSEMGRLASGNVADFVQFDDEFQVHGVWVAGKRHAESAWQA